MRAIAAGLGLAAALAIAAVPAQADPTLVPLAGSWNQPVYLTAPPRDTSRVFVVEQGGLVKVVVDGVEQPDPFADLTADVISGGERGLLSIAFSPDYETSGLLYAYYTADPNGELQVAELHRSATDPNLTDGTSRIVWRQVHDEADNHNGGTVAFGPDGMLWLATGDGGGSNDGFHHAQDLGSQLGKLLRIDPRPFAGRGYTVPPENPYTGAGEAIWAAGLRNPFRFSFDRGTGDLVIGDVGQSAREEVDWVRFEENLGRTGNFGWPCFEGDAAGPRACSPAGYIPPVHDYSQGSPRAIDGGVVVRDPALPTLVGRYVYADTYAGDVRSLVLGRPATDDSSTGLSSSAIVAFGEDACGHVYVVSLSGTVDRIQDGAPGACVLEPAPRPLPMSRPSAATPSPTPTPGGAPAAAADKRPPAVRVGISGRRTLLERRRLRVSITVDEPAATTVAGKLRRVARFRPAQGQLAAGRATVLRARITRRAARALRRTLRRRGRALAVLTVRARDAAGNERAVTRRVVIRRR